MDFSILLKDIATKYNIDAIGFFGSRARGDYNEYSDFDIFIIGDINLSKELELEAELEDMFPSSVDVIKLTEETDKFLLKNVMNDGVVFYNKNNVFEKLYNFVECFFKENSDFLYYRKRDLLD